MVSVLPSASSALARSEGSGQIVGSPLQATAMPQKRLPLAMVVTALLLLLVPTVRLMGAEPMILSPELKRLSLGGHMDILEDQARQWTIRDIVAEQVAAQFTPSHGEAPGFGFTSSAYWVRFVVVNPWDREIQWCLEVAYPPMDSIVLYIPTQANQFQIKRGGDHLPFHARDVDYRDFIFLLQTPPKSQQIYYMRFENAGAINLPLTILSLSALAEKINHEQLLLGIYHGAILVMLVYNFFIFISIRDLSYLYYVLFNCGWVFAMLTLNGLAFQYLWPRAVWWTNHSLLFFFCFSFMWGVQFSRSFLDTAHQTPVFDILLRALIALAVLGMACALLTSYYISVRLTNIIGMTCALVWINGILCLRRGVRAARYYVIAWSALILGITILSLKNFGILPHNAFTVWAPQIGSATEITLLSLGLADRIRTLRREKERAEKALIDTQLTIQDALLKEVHHRVKNNLQVIASLLNLQSRQVRDAQTVEMFKESQNRVQSMALIHERLYQSNDATRVDFESYLRTLMAYLFASYGSSNTAIALTLNVDHITFGIDTAIPCGLIVHELVANALKHAFPGSKPGEIHLDLRAGDTGRYTLRVHDNGDGFPENVDFRRVESLGLKLVNILTQQLDGVIELQRNGGTTFTITFTELQYQKRV
jgi:two-component sensor histidine kinase